jgi:serine/threonine protein kinase
MHGQGEVSGRYRIEGELGRGGMGVVYRAHDLLLDRPVALKRPLGPHERARREAHALRLLKLPGAVELLDEGEDAAGPFLVTEIVTGSPFPGRGWPVEDLAAQLLEVLASVHAAGILHRDLKPQNVIVDGLGHVHVLDFGVARGPALGSRSTEIGGGTPRYLAPEQLAGAPEIGRAHV